MHITIWKYGVPLGLEALQLPRGAKILTLQMQGNKPTLWAEINPQPEHPVVRRGLIWVTTGGQVPHPRVYEYVGTIQALNDSVVFHLYVEKEV